MNIKKNEKFSSNKRGFLENTCIYEVILTLVSMWLIWDFQNSSKEGVLN